MKNEESRSLACPFCGAPQRQYIPTDAVQIRCQYCGGVFLTPPRMGGETYRCLNHPERLAVGTCNDCAESFCGDCLHQYSLNTEAERATLYLCPTCLRRRHIEKADFAIFLGIVLLVFAIFLGAVSPPASLAVGTTMAVAGVGAIIYGYYRGRETPEELTIDELRLEKQRRQAELAVVGGFDTEEIFDKLVSQYVDRWGVVSGLQTLESEIMAYTRRGVSFDEAVKKVYQRQAKKPT